MENCSTKDEILTYCRRTYVLIVCTKAVETFKVTIEMYHMIESRLTDTIIRQWYDKTQDNRHITYLCNSIRTVVASVIVVFGKVNTL